MFNNNYFIADDEKDDIKNDGAKNLTAPNEDQSSTTPWHQQLLKNSTELQDFFKWIYSKSDSDIKGWQEFEQFMLK